MKENYHVLCFGDSLTAGTPGYEPGYGGDVRSQYGFWLGEESRKCGMSGFRFTNAGIPGELASTMHNRLGKILSSGTYDAVIILAGTNDIGWGIAPQEVFVIVSRLWSVSVDRGLETIACTVPPVGTLYPPLQDAQRELNNTIMRAVGSHRLLHIVDVFSVLSTDEMLLLPAFDSGDGLHLSVQGYKRMGETIWNGALKDLVLRSGVS